MSEYVGPPLGHGVDFERLSEGQQACLRLVAQYHSSKEVARVLGISPHTVDQRLKRAIAIMGVSTRAEAARLFVAHDRYSEGTQSHHDLVYQPSDLSTAPTDARLHGLGGDLDPSLGVAAEGLRESQSLFFAGGMQGVSSPPWWQIGWDVGTVNRFPAAMRMALILAFGVVSVLMLGTLVSIAEGLSRLSP